MQPDRFDVAATGWQREPIDPDTAVDLPAFARTPPLRNVLAAITAGGVIGASARYGASLLWPAMPGAFAWTTFSINVSGCALMGVLMVLITERFTAHPLVRPFFGTGVLGGYTTFSTYAIDAQHLFDRDRDSVALLYLAATLVASLIAVWGGVALTRLLIRPGAGT